jgi:polyhydroxyalkanoate synthesis regulator phasin
MNIATQQQPFQRLPADDQQQTSLAVRDVYDKLEIVLSQLNSANQSIAALNQSVTALTARVAKLETP